MDVAGVVHDYLYRHPKNTTRAEDDRIWWLLARSGKWRADPVQAALCWLALRGFGWTSRPAARQFNPFWYLAVLLIGTSVAVWLSRLIWFIVEACVA